MKEKQAGWEVNNPGRAGAPMLAAKYEQRIADLEERMDVWDRRLAKWAQRMKLEE